MTIQTLNFSLPVKNLVIKHLLVASIPDQLRLRSLVDFPSFPLFSSGFLYLIQLIQRIAGNQLTHMLFVVFQIYLGLVYFPFHHYFRHSMRYILVKLFLHRHLQPVYLVVVQGLEEVLA